MSDPVRWGILGTGGINDRFLKNIRDATSARFVAVGSRSGDRARAFAARHDVPTAHGSYEGLLDDPDVEVVYICLPNGLHHEWTMRALDAGKHVLCEKPYTRHPADVDEAFDAADRAGLLLMEGFMWRHTPQARRFVELLPEIGELRHVRATFSFVLEDASDIRLRADLAGGSLMDVGCYCVSGIRRTVGREPEAVYGEQLVGSSGVDVRFTGVLRFAGGLTATIASGFESDHATLEAIGSRGSLFLRDPWTGRARSLLLDGREMPVTPADPYVLEVENLSAAIRGEGRPLLGREDALGQARVIASLYESAASGAPVSLEA